MLRLSKLFGNPGFHELLQSTCQDIGGDALTRRLELPVVATSMNGDAEESGRATQ